MLGTEYLGVVRFYRKTVITIWIFAMSYLKRFNKEIVFTFFPVLFCNYSLLLFILRRRIKS